MRPTHLCTQVCIWITVLSVGTGCYADANTTRSAVDTTARVITVDRTKVAQAAIAPTTTDRAFSDSWDLMNQVQRDGMIDDVTLLWMTKGATDGLGYAVITTPGSARTMPHFNFVPELFPEFIAEYGLRNGSESLQVHAREIAEGFRTTLELSGTALTGDVHSTSANVEKAMLTHSLIVANESAKLPPERALQSKHLEIMARKMFRASMAQSQARYDGERLMSTSAIEALLKVQPILVAIAIEDQTSSRVVGTGFIYFRGEQPLVLTAAHVLGDSSLHAGGRPSSRPSYAKLRIRFLENGGFGEPITVNADKSRVFVGIDTAVLVPDSVPPGVVHVPRSPVVTGPDKLVKGLVFGFGVQFRKLNGVEVPYVVWMPPGRIAFPAMVRKLAQVPVDGTMSDRIRSLELAIKEQTVDDAYLRCLRQAVVGALYLDDGVSETPFADLVSRAILRVDGIYRFHCTEADCEMQSPGDHSLRYLEDMPPRTQTVFMPAFGTDLASAQGCSGAPIFTFRDDQVFLAGMHSGLAGQDSRDFQPCSLDNFGRVVPFYRIKEKVDAAYPVPQ